MLEKRYTLKMDYNSLAFRFRELRKKKMNNMSQEDLMAELLDNGYKSINRGKYGRCENGDVDELKNLKLGFLDALCDLYGIDIGHLFGLYDESSQTLHDICDYTGLNEQAIENLHAEISFKDKFDACRVLPNYINSLVCDSLGDLFIRLTYSYERLKVLNKDANQFLNKVLPYQSSCDYRDDYYKKVSDELQIDFVEAMRDLALSIDQERTYYFATMHELQERLHSCLKSVLSEDDFMKTIDETYCVIDDLYGEFLWSGDELYRYFKDFDKFDKEHCAEWFKDHGVTTKTSTNEFYKLREQYFHKELENK